MRSDDLPEIHIGCKVPTKESVFTGKRNRRHFEGRKMGGER